ncbi:MAG TPA: universal stress protein [Acidimicrobiales bacterium]|nr:universal stress protein [Acidimicrobiales bacterium]
MTERTDPAATTDPDLRPIVVGVDGSEESRRALAWALDAARRRGVAVRAVHTWHYPTWLLGGGTDAAPGAPEEMEAAARGALDRALADADTTGVEVDAIVVQADPAVVLVDEAAGAAMVVIGRRGMGGVRRLLLGSVSSVVLHDAPCPVVVLPPEVQP